MPRDRIFICGNTMGLIGIASGFLAALFAFVRVPADMAIPISIVGLASSSVGIVLLFFGRRWSPRIPLAGGIICAMAFLLCMVVEFLAIGATAGR